MNRILQYKHEIILVVFILIYIIYFTTASFLRFNNFYAGRFDLGNMDQVVWNTSRGRIFQMTDPNGTNIISRLAFHADFILILLAPLYFLWSSPLLLLLIQTLVVAAGTIFIFVLAKKILKSKNIALVFSFIFLLNPALEHANLYDFHPVALATTFLLGTMYFLLNKKTFLFLVFALLAALTKEQVWLIITLIGFYMFVTNYQRRLGFLLFLLSLSVFYYLVWYAIPHARGGNHFALSYYSDFGDSPTAIVKNALFSPDKIFRALFLQDRKDYLYQLLLPLGFLPVLSPLSLLFALPDLLFNLLSNNANLRQIYFHYSATIIPFIFTGAIFGIKNLQKIFPKIPLFFYSSYLIFATLYAAYSFGPLPGAKKPNIDMFIKPQANKEAIQKILAKIRKRYSIAATNNIGSYLSHRQEIFTIPVGVEKADFVIFLLNDPSTQPSLKAQKDLVNRLKYNKNYVLVFQKDDFILFKRRNAVFSR